MGKFTLGDVANAVSDDENLRQLRGMAEEMAAFWGAVEATADCDRKRTLLERYSAEIMLQANRYNSLLNKLGLQGPMAD